MLSILITGCLNMTTVCATLLVRDILLCKLCESTCSGKKCSQKKIDFHAIAEFSNSLLLTASRSFQIYASNHIIQRGATYNIFFFKYRHNCTRPWGECNLFSLGIFSSENSPHFMGEIMLFSSIYICEKYL